MGIMIPMKRERMLTIRVTDDEHARLLERCEGKQLAVWMRRVCLGEPVARSGRLPTLAPPLLRQLAAIGNNLNQTARKVNSGQWSSGDRVQVVAVVRLITCWEGSVTGKGQRCFRVIRKKYGNSSMPRHLRRNTRPVCCRSRRRSCHREDVKR